MSNRNRNVSRDKAVEVEAKEARQHLIDQYVKWLQAIDKYLLEPSMRQLIKRK
jgi:hypothetical protein